MLRRDFGRKNQLNWSLQFVAPSRTIYTYYRGSPPCAIFHHPRKKEILHSYVLHCAPPPLVLPARLGPLKGWSCECKTGCLELDAKSGFLGRKDFLKVWKINSSELLLKRNCRKWELDWSTDNNSFGRQPKTSNFMYLATFVIRRRESL